MKLLVRLLITGAVLAVMALILPYVMPTSPSLTQIRLKPTLSVILYGMILTTVTAVLLGSVLVLSSVIEQGLRPQLPEYDTFTPRPLGNGNDGAHLLVRMSITGPRTVHDYENAGRPMWLFRYPANATVVPSRPLSVVCPEWPVSFVSR